MRDSNHSQQGKSKVGFKVRKKYEVVDSWSGSRENVAWWWWWLVAEPCSVTGELSSHCDQASVTRRFQVI